MYELIIENYIKNLERNDIIYFAKKNNIYLSDLELDFVFKTIKCRFKDLLSDNYEYIFLDAKNYLSKENYDKVCNLFLDYRNKFKNYLK